jgi:hypothetical protein
MRADTQYSGENLGAPIEAPNFIPIFGSVWITGRSAAAASAAIHHADCLRCTQANQP